MLPFQNVPVLATILLALLICNRCAQASSNKEEHGPIYLQDYRPGPYKIGLDMPRNIECKTSLENVTVFWTNPEGSRIDNKTSSNIRDLDGELHIMHAKINDSGIYTCFTSDLKYNVTADIFVYIMPSYKTEGFIILAINGVLLVIFGICLIHSYFQHKRTGYKQAPTNPEKLKNPF